MALAIVGWVVASSLGLIALAVVVAAIDNRVNYGRWYRRRKRQGGLGEPQSGADRDTFYGGDVP
jgi:hypothetical protein